MKMRILPVVVAILAIGAAAPSQAGPSRDEFQRCLISKTTEGDRTTLMRWMLAVISSDPQLKSLTTFSEAQRTKASLEAAAVIQRLTIDDCRAQALAAVRQEGPQSLGMSFNVLGQESARQMFESPAAKAELGRLGSGFDGAKLKAFLEEAGIPPK